jgi:tyrosyl-tRNA synthetase
MQRSRGQEPQIVLTMPLLEGLDGVNKMSKSLGNYIGISEPANDIYGKAMSISDELMFRYFELVSDRSSQEIEELEKGIANGSLHPKEVKQQLAYELTARFHSADAAAGAAENFENVFARKDLPDELNECTISSTEDIWLPKLLVEAGLVSSSSEGRRMIKQKAVSIDGIKIADENHQVVPKEPIVVKVGKRRFCRVVFA